MAESQFEAYVRALDEERERCRAAVERAKERGTGDDVDASDVAELERLHEATLEARKAWMMTVTPHHM